MAEALRDWPSWDLTPPQLSDLEMLVSGAWAPMRGFMTRAEAAHSGSPVQLELPPAVAAKLSRGGKLALRDPEGVLLAALSLDDVWENGAGGPLESPRLPTHYDFRDLRRSPAELREAGPFLAWQPFGDPDPDELAAAAAAARDRKRKLLIQLVIGMPSAGDAAYYARVRAWRAACPERATLALLPLVRRDFPLAARAALNSGATHLLSDDGKAGFPGLDLVAFPRRPPPAPAPRGRGYAVFFTGLSGSGKSTIANVLLVKLLERGGRPVTLLDGDIVRKHLSSELGFSKAHRDLNIRRIGFVAAEIVRHGGIVLCAPIAPYDSVRKEVRSMIERQGTFVLVHVSTPIELCEERDRKGLYAKARAGLLPGFTGISDPYEPPADAEVVIDTTRTTSEEEADRILDWLRGSGLLA